VLIGSSVHKVDNGSTLVADAGQTMNEIVTSVKRVSDLIGEISAATRRQSTASTRSAPAVTQLDQVTQQNAALVEESAAAAGSLRDQARALAQAVSVLSAPDAQGGASGTGIEVLKSSAVAKQPRIGCRQPHTSERAAKSPAAPRAVAPVLAPPPTATGLSSDPECGRNEEADVKLDHEVDVKSRYFRDPAGQCSPLHTADRTPDSRAKPLASGSNCIGSAGEPAWSLRRGTQRAQSLVSTV